MSNMYQRPPPPVALVRTPPSIIAPINEKAVVINATVRELAAMGVTFPPPACDVALAAENEALKVRSIALEVRCLRARDRLDAHSGFYRL